MMPDFGSGPDCHPFQGLIRKLKSKLNIKGFKKSNIQSKQHTQEDKHLHITLLKACVSAIFLMID